MSKTNIPGFNQDDLDFPYWEDKASELASEELDDDGFDEFVKRVKKREKYQDIINDLEEED